MDQNSDVRIDKWLWAVRIFKTRSLASEACKTGQVRINGLNVKPSRNILINEIVDVRRNPIVRSYRVKGILAKRLSAKLVVDFVEDITSEEELKKLDMVQKSNVLIRDRGTGRPTKRDRRDIDQLKNNL